MAAATSHTFPFPPPVRSVSVGSGFEITADARPVDSRRSATTGKAWAARSPPVMTWAVMRFNVRNFLLVAVIIKLLSPHAW